VDIAKSTMDRVTWRLVPLLIAGYFVAYLDRVNIGVASLTMNRDLGFSPGVFAFGAGIFFLGYFVFEVPSNLFLHRFGARRWIARIMLSWGVVAGAMALIQGETSFYALRLLLGIAEAGFFPGVILYATTWFPAAYRARVVGLFAVALPLSGVIGNPVSASLLGLNGVLGIEGWRWLFVLEAIPSVILAAVVWRRLTDRPEAASWLPPAEKAWLVAELAREAPRERHAGAAAIAAAALSWPVIALSAIYFGIGASGYGLSFFLPQIVKEFGLTNLQTGFVSAIPYVAAGFGMVWWGARSDRSSERHLHAAGSFALAAAGMIGAGFASDPVVRMVMISLGALGAFASIPVFWALPTGLSGAAAAAGIAVVNAVGNLAGFVGPMVIAQIRTATGSFAGGLFAIGGTAVLSALLVLMLRAAALGAAAPHPAR